MTKDKSEMFWTDGHGKEQRRSINYTLDIRNFEDAPGYALLFMAANGHLSVGDAERWLLHIAKVGRGRTWIQRRRWLFQKPGTINPQGRVNRDGKDKLAIQVMQEYPSTSSIRFLVNRLKERGIIRGKDWVRLNRPRSV